ncbi:MAG: dihydropteroate synthase [Halodesulfurarchaeum sp.]
MRTVRIDEMAIGDGHPPRIMGVLNMSGESNYGPSVYPDPATAARYAEVMAESGADIVDVGLQSANPKNDWLPQSTEMKRLDRAIAVLEAADTDAVFSIETRYADVADEALASGFDLINDVCGFADPEMPAVCEAHDAPVVKMASPPDVTKPGHLKDVGSIFEALERGGFTEKTIIDPAFGGWYDQRTFEDNWELFRRLREFRAFGRPILTATNREDFLGAIADRMKTDEQLPVSLAAATMEVERGVHVIRTHDVPETHDAIQVASFLGDERHVEAPSITEVTATTRLELEQVLSLNTVQSANGKSGSAIRAFQVEPPTELVAAAVLEWATETDLTVVGGYESGLHIAGTEAEFDTALAAPPPSTAAAVTVGSLRRALNERTS